MPRHKRAFVMLVTNFAVDIVGWCGACLTLGAYLQDQDVLHLSGALLLAAYSIFYGMWPQVITNVVWMLVAVHKQRTVRNQPEELHPPSV